ncbi:MAG: GTP 3',8-cyclase MoaA [Pseudomonadales bacterium]|nr:GTP 3',8-cyclase MoaA [Pseudomonadales bacterium]
MSVTDRCDFRCVYCMSEHMTFLPRAQVLTLEELAFIGETFVELGVKKIRLTGGEPLIRHNVEELFDHLGALPTLQELTFTTNGSHLAQYAERLKQAGVKRINISLDSLKPDLFKELTRIGELQQVLAGIEKARQVGFQRIKLNAVILSGRNSAEVLDLLRFALDRGLDISYIEEMPLGSITEHNRGEAFCSSQHLRDMIGQEFELIPTSENSGGPSKYWRIPGYNSRVGFISPHSENFCSTCNRVRLTVEGRLLLCLGNEHSIDLRSVVRNHPGNKDKLIEAIMQGMSIKPERHYFELDNEPQILRFMNTTGG